MCRGYGMSCALATTSLSYLITAYHNARARHIWIALLFAILASYANFTLLVFWMAVLILSCVFLILQKDTFKKTFHSFLILALITVLYGALIYLPIVRMTAAMNFSSGVREVFIKKPSTL